MCSANERNTPTKKLLNYYWQKRMNFFFYCWQSVRGISNVLPTWKNTSINWKYQLITLLASSISSSIVSMFTGIAFQTTRNKKYFCLLFKLILWVFCSTLHNIAYIALFIPHQARKKLNIHLEKNGMLS